MYSNLCKTYERMEQTQIDNFFIFLGWEGGLGLQRGEVTKVCKYFLESYEDWSSSAKVK